VARSREADNRRVGAVDEIGKVGLQNPPDPQLSAPPNLQDSPEICAANFGFAAKPDVSA